MIKQLSFIAVFIIVGVMLGKPAWDRWGLPWYRAREYDDLLSAEGRKAEVDPRLLRAVIWQESRFEAIRIGKAGEIGLMQVTPTAAMEWAHVVQQEALDFSTLLDAHSNIAAGAWYLHRALQRWASRHDPLPYALAEYNAGLSNVRRWDKEAGGSMATNFADSIGYPTTQRYVREIIRRYRGGSL
jgi:soluble lytic murein transglycosylase